MKSKITKEGVYKAVLPMIISKFAKQIKIAFGI